MIICGGTFNFIYRYCAYKKLNSSIITLYSVFVALSLSTVFLILFGKFSFSIYMILSALIGGIFIVNRDICRINSMKNIDSSIFFPFSRILSIISFIFIGILFFNEYLNRYELLGVLIGFLGILLLGNKKDKKRQNNYRLGILFYPSRYEKIYESQEELTEYLKKKEINNVFLNSNITDGAEPEPEPEYEYKKIEGVEFNYDLEKINYLMDVVGKYNYQNDIRINKNIFGLLQLIK